MISSDAHDPAYVGRFEEACTLLNQVGFTKELLINTDVKKFKLHIGLVS